MEERKDKRVRSEQRLCLVEDPPRSDKRQRTTRKKKEENVVVSRGSSSSEGRRGRGRKSNGGEGSKRSTERDMSSPDKEDDSEGTNKYAGLTCHQCKVLMSKKSDLVFCSKCIKTRYCYDCIERWYPKRTPEEVQAACPFCLRNCNCRACLREPLAVKQRNEKEADVKLKQLQYLLVKVLPVLRDIYTEQKRELEIETAIRGVPVTESDVIKCELHPRVRIYWSVFQSSRSIFASSFCSSHCFLDNDISSFLAKQNVSILFLVCFANRQ
ncbi:hypothetical protein Bca101_019172 [Brassica carinata]